MKYTIKEYPDIISQVEKMDVDELLRSVICPNYIPGVTKPLGYEVAAFLHPTTEENVKKEIVDINKDRDDKTIIVSDLEYGTGKMIKGTTSFPSLMAAAKCGDPNLAYEMGVQTAKKAGSVGYHWTFSPCVDILENPRNPIVSVRTAGTDADTVIKYGGAYMKGLIDSGMYITLKHFPGDGYSDHDQHVTTTENPLSREEWDATVGKVYSTLIEEGAQTIMPGHISLACYDEIDENTGLYPPATISKNLLTGLLREKLGFEGIIVSDAVNMSGFCGYTNLYRAAALFLEAGGDCLLFMHANDEFLSEMKKQIKNGILSIETLKNRAVRMRSFVRQYFEDYKTPVADDKALAECCKKITTGAIEVLRDRANVLPLKIKDGVKIAHMVLYNLGQHQAEAAPAALTREIQKRGAQVDVFYDPGPGEMLKNVKNNRYDYIICSIVNEMSYGLNTVKLSGALARNMMHGWMRYGTPAIFISYYDPYFAYDYNSITDTVINTYGMGDFTAEAIIEKICEK